MTERTRRDRGLAYQATSILALGAETDRARACLLEPVDDQYRLIGWSDVPIGRGETAEQDLVGGLVQACRRLGVDLDRPLWDPEEDRPLMENGEPALRLALGQVTAVANPLPPLRVWIAGLSSGGSLAAAADAVANTTAQAVALYRLDADADPAALERDLRSLRPDVAVVVGAYDDPRAVAQEAVLGLCELLGSALSAIEPENRPRLFYAGNRWAAEEVLELWQRIPGKVVATAVANVMPAADLLHQSSLAVALAREYWSRCRTFPPLTTLAGWVTRPVELRSVSWSFAQVVRVWMESRSLPELHGLYAGPDWWMHVWAVEGHDDVWIRFAPPKARPDFLVDWPPLQLVSGDWPESLWPRPSQYWWDRIGLAPVVMAVGQADPVAALQVLTHDLLSSKV